MRRFFGDQLEPGRRGTKRIANRASSIRLVCVSTQPWQSAVSWSSTRVTVCRPEALFRIERTTDRSARPWSASHRSKSAAVEIGIARDTLTGLLRPR